MTKRMMPQKRMNNTDFVRAWMTAHAHKQSANELAQALKVTPSNVSHRARRLRGRGVKLPDLADGRRREERTEIALLNSIVTEALGS